MSAASIKRLPNSLRFGGTRLHHGYTTGQAPQPDGVRRVNEHCIELESFANLTRSGSAIFIGMSTVTACAISTYLWFIATKPWGLDDWIQTVVLGLVCVAIAIV